MLSLWRGLAEGEGLARSAGCSRVVWLRARPFAREDSPFWGHECRAPWCCPAVNSPCAGREAAGPAPRLTSLFCCRNSELRVRHQGPRMSGPEQRCRGLVPAEEGERAAALLGGGRDWARSDRGPLPSPGACGVALHVPRNPPLPFVSSSALDCQQSLRAGVFPQRGGAAALEQRQHRLHLARGPLHLRRLLGKRERSPGRTRVAAVGGRHVRGLVPLRRQRAG